MSRYTCGDYEPLLAMASLPPMGFHDSDIPALPFCSPGRSRLASLWRSWGMVDQPQNGHLLARRSESRTRRGRPPASTLFDDGLYSMTGHAQRSKTTLQPRFCPLSSNVTAAPPKSAEMNQSGLKRLEPPTGFEPATRSLQKSRSTTELQGLTPLCYPR